MGQKIAVVNFKEDARMFLAEALSSMSGYPLVQNRNIYEWIRMYQIDENQLNSWENQFLLMSSSLVKRIKSEYRHSEFIADGAVFSETLSLKLNEKSIVLKQEEIAILESMLGITGRHASAHYDRVIHIQNEDSAAFDELSIRFYDKYQIAYRLYDCKEDMEEMIEHIIREVELPAVEEVRNALDKAERFVNFKSWKS